jgi:4-hydroxy-3-polyprenylbenzoate decarboxylase
MIDQTLGRILDLFDLETGLVRRWGEAPVDGERPLRSKPRGGKV